MGDRWVELEGRLKAAARKHWTYRLDLLGRVDDRPFYRLTIPHRGRHNYSLCLASGVHGDEPAGVEALLRLIEDQAIPSGVSITCFPCMNPAGFDDNRREDTAGQDLNRLFGTENPPEQIRLFQEAVQGAHYDLFIDLHEDSGTSGFYAFEVTCPGATLGPKLVKAMVDRCVTVECADALTRVLQADGLMPSKGTIEDGLALVEPDGVPTCFAQAVYMYGERASHVMTFESPSPRPLEERVTMHLEGMRFILEQLGTRNRFWEGAHQFMASEPLL